MSTSASPPILYPGARLPKPTDGKSIRFSFLFGGCKISAIYYHRPEYSDRLFVGFNGAVEREAEKDPREVFQRRTWAESIEASCLFISDPTLHQHNEIQIGWAQGSAFSRPFTTMAQCVDFIREILEIESNSRILFFGSSAGGFQAVQMHSRFPGSRFLVNNAQFDWSKYYKRFVDTIMRNSHPGISLNELREQDPSSINALNQFIELDIPFCGDYWVNTASKIDYAAQLPVVNDFIANRARLKKPENLDFATHYYFDTRSGHTPMPKDKTLTIINNALSRISGEE